MREILERQRAAFLQRAPPAAGAVLFRPGPGAAADRARPHHVGRSEHHDTLLQYLQEDLPFGGIGSSGMDCKAVFEQSRVNLADLLRPPYRKRVAALVGVLMR